MISTPLIIGHRGASAVAPENTLSAFARALEDGADGVEFDVRLSCDGVPVVIHDGSLKRTAQIDFLVAELTAAELQQCDASQWFNQPLSQTKQHPGTIPILAHVFELFRQTNSLLYLEMKSDDGASKNLAEAVVQEIHRSQLIERVVVSSFDLDAVSMIKEIDPSIRTAALFEPKLSRPISTLRRLKMIDIAGEHGADEIACHHSLVTANLVEKAKQFDLPVVVWTVDDVRWIPRAHSLGIKALITNNPAAMVALRNSTE